jgi:serine phosphatase RsbU (regulator of sigma subunit)
MLELGDLIRLPHAEKLLQRIVAAGQGLTLVAGLDQRPSGGQPLPGGLRPSGRATVFRILLREILTNRAAAQAIFVAGEQGTVRIPPSLRKRIEIVLVPLAGTYAQTIGRAAAKRPGLLVIDSLTAESATAALAAAAGGCCVLSQLDTVFRGAEVARHLVDLGVPGEILGSLSWIVAVQRLATLCPRCKQPTSTAPAQVAELRRRYPDLGGALAAVETLYDASGCPRCHFTGREGEVSIFDLHHARPDNAGLSAQESSLTFERYILGLATEGYLSLDDVVDFEACRLHGTYSLLAASEHNLTTTNRELKRKLAELEIANRVLQQRTEALISLEGIGQALIRSAGLDDLAARLCRSARDLCGADRSVLYFLRADESRVEIVAECGWDPSLIHQQLDAASILGPDPPSEPSVHHGLPPGVPHRPADLTASALRIGLRVPLVADDKQLGLMIVHTSQKSRFTPGEVALLQTFANQASVAIQRASLIDALQDKITKLEAAQAELAKKERLEHELELARRVQESVLPRAFPAIPGYAFGAISKPARWVGGDFYDLIPLDDHRLGIVIGDVSDKGMPAALYMAQVHSLWVVEARRNDAPRAVLASVHRLLQQLGRTNMFVTVFYGILDQPSCLLTYARAGHDRPLLQRGGSTRSLAGEGTVLGFPDLERLYLSEEQLQLHPGDRLVLYSDGLIDTVAPSGQSFGLTRLVALLEAHLHLPPEELCPATFAHLDTYQSTAEQFDDMTMLVVDVT